MAVYGIYDYDFFHYENVIPNLECAKLITYYRTHNEIATLTPTFNPAPYTQFLIRKEYDDGIYPKSLFEDNCVYGGRAFNPRKYKPLAQDIENTIPDMSIYERYSDYFGKKGPEKTLFKRVLNCAHIRLASDSQTIAPMSLLKKNFEQKVTGIIFHDYDLASLDALPIIKELQNQRHFRIKEGINPYPIGNKYPIEIYDLPRLYEWIDVVTIPNVFLIEYNGELSDEILYELCLRNRRLAYQIYYNITYGCSSEEDFLKNRLRKIFIQTLFLRKAGVRILLKYEDGFFVTKELENLIKLLNSWIHMQWFDGFLPRTQSLYQLCRKHRLYQYTSWGFRHITLTVEENRAIFQYIREKDYDLFKMFYEWDSVIYKGGHFVNEWE